MLKLDDIKAPIAREMDEFETKFRASMKTRVLLLDKIMNYIVKRKGKQMRPMFVFLSAGMCGRITESTFLTMWWTMPITAGVFFRSMPFGKIRLPFS